MSNLITSADLGKLLETIQRTGTMQAAELYKRLQNATMRMVAERGNYPPTNIAQLDDNTWQIEMAVAGFKRDELSVSLKNELMTIGGEKQVSARAPNQEFPISIHTGIATRTFNSTYELPEGVDQFTAKLEDGILTVTVSRPAPKVEGPIERQINIE